MVTSTTDRTSYKDEHEKEQIVVHFSTQKFDVGDLIRI